MSAAVLPFPLAARRDLVRRQAARYLEQSAKSAEGNLQHQLRVQRDTMLRRGIDPVTVEQECAELQSAIRCEVWRLVLTPEAG